MRGRRSAVRPAVGPRRAGRAQPSGAASRDPLGAAEAFWCVLGLPTRRLAGHRRRVVVMPGSRMGQPRPFRVCWGCRGRVVRGGPGDASRGWTRASGAWLLCRGSWMGQPMLFRARWGCRCDAWQDVGGRRLVAVPGSRITRDTAHWCRLPRRAGLERVGRMGLMEGCNRRRVGMRFYQRDHAATGCPIAFDPSAKRRRIWAWGPCRPFAREAARPCALAQTRCLAHFRPPCRPPLL
mgnify:CR=1 FL=1